MRTLSELKTVALQCTDALEGFFISNPEAVTDAMKLIALDEGACPIMVEVALADQFCKVIS